MLLRSVRLDNFRGIKSARISFDATTVLIGENDCGRSSAMEAIALVLGWNCNEGEFVFHPFHIHRSGCEPDSAAPPISIALEFSETFPGEWNGEAFELLRASLPDVLSEARRFWFEVEHNSEDGTQWMFRSDTGKPLINDGAMLAWLRRRMPVFWMPEGMVAARRFEFRPELPAERPPDRTEQVSRDYRDLLEGTALDVSATIKSGFTAASELLLDRVRFVRGHTTPLSELLEQITGERAARSATPRSEPLRSFGTSAHQIGVLLLAGALLRSGAAKVESGLDPLTLIENPEAHLHPMTLASIWGVIDRIGGQKIIATHSGTLLACARLSSVRRFTRQGGVVKEWRVPDGALTADELRRYFYHLRSRRAEASFARCWLLVEGETEYWMMDELARVSGYEFASEGVACVEFAQCGLDALIKVAQHFGIEWHLLADGDAAGQHYARTAREYSGTDGIQDHITVLRDADIEHCFWRCGFQEVFRHAAYPRDASGPSTAAHRRPPAKATIARAISRYSKPYLAALLLDAVIDRGAGAIPPPLRRVIETCIRLARRGPTTHPRSGPAEPDDRPLWKTQAG